MSFTPIQVARLERVYQSLGVWPLRFAPTTRLLAKRMQGYGMSPEASLKRIWRDVISYAHWCNGNASSPGAAFCAGVSRMPVQPAPGTEQKDQMYKDENREGSPVDDWIKEDGPLLMDFGSILGDG